MEQKGLETAGVWSELVPDDFTEQDDGNVVFNLKRTHVQVSCNSGFVQQAVRVCLQGYLLEFMCFIYLYLMFGVFYLVLKKQKMNLQQFW